MAKETYPTTVPYFSVDVDHLRSLLEDARNGITSHKLRPSPLNGAATADLSEREYAAAAKRASHSRRSSTYTPGANDHKTLKLEALVHAGQRRLPRSGRPKFRFLVECEAQVRRLFNFLEQHLGKAECDLAVLLSLQPQGGSGTAGANRQTSIQLIESGGAGGGDLESARIHASHLRHLRDVLVSLQITLKTGFLALEELAEMYDQRSPTPDGRAFLEEKTQRKEELEARMATSLRKVNAWLQLFFHRYNMQTEQAKSRPSQIQVTFLDTEAFAQIKNEKVDYLAGLSLMLFLALCTVTVYMYIWNGSSTATWVVFFRMVRSPLLVVLYLFLLALNMKVWAQANINYASIFDFPKNGVATPNYLLGVAALFTVLFAIAIITFLIVSPYTFVVPGKLIPLAMWLVLLLFLVNPLNKCLYNGRKSFVSILLRILISPFTEPRFGDVWLAIQVNSMAVILLDLEYTACYCVQGPWRGEMNPTDCTGSENAVRPLIASFPAFIQILQNLKLFADRRQWRFLANAIKYSTSFPIIIFATLFSISLPNTVSFHFHQIIGNPKLEWLGGCWLVSAIFHSVFTFAWDVYYHWGLWHFSDRTILRPILLYQWTALYHLATFLDLIFQSFWALEITLAIVWRYNDYQDLIYTGLVVGEILRCFMWNFFKLEYQQIQRLTA